jgi:hypothetical protein
VGVLLNGIARFDEIDHHVLVSLLHKRISDDRFISLIWKALRVEDQDVLQGVDLELPPWPVRRSKHWPSHELL